MLILLAMIIDYTIDDASMITSIYNASSAIMITSIDNDASNMITSIDKASSSLL